jgi:hypothetical protein
MSDTVLFKADEVDNLSNENGLERYGEVKTHRFFMALRSSLIMIDRRDGILGNEPLINNSIKVCDMGVNVSVDIHARNLRQQRIIDKPTKEIA